MPRNNRKLSERCDACREYLIKQLEKNIPQTGKIKGCGVHFSNVIPVRRQRCGVVKRTA